MGILPENGFNDMVDSSNVFEKKSPADISRGSLVIRVHLPIKCSQVYKDIQNKFIVNKFDLC